MGVFYHHPNPNALIYINGRFKFQNRRHADSASWDKAFWLRRTVDFKPILPNSFFRKNEWKVFLTVECAPTP